MQVLCINIDDEKQFKKKIYIYIPIRVLIFEYLYLQKS